MKRVLAAMLISAGLLGSAWGQSARPKTFQDLARHKGSDRERLLYEGARREGSFMLYTTLTVHKKLITVFESKYKGVTAEVYRARGADMASRVIGEAQAQRKIADAIEAPSSTLMRIRENNLFLPYDSPSLASYPESAKENATQDLVFMTFYRESYSGVVYNTKLVPDSDVPRKFDDLLRPSLKGKMGVASSESALRDIGAMLTTKGEGFLKKLALQNIRQYTMGALGLTNLVASGELPLMITGYKSNADLAASKGAPVAWIPHELVATNAGGAAVMANAPHPHAALLFVDFLIGPEGRKTMDEFGYGSPSEDYGFKRWYPERGLTLRQYEELLEKWQKLLAGIVQK